MNTVANVAPTLIKTFTGGSRAPKPAPKPSPPKTANYSQGEFQDSFFDHKIQFRQERKNNIFCSAQKAKDTKVLQQVMTGLKNPSASTTSTGNNCKCYFMKKQDLICRRRTFKSKRYRDRIFYLFH